MISVTGPKTTRWTISCAASLVLLTCVAAASTYAQVPNADEERCITTLNRSGASVVRAQARVNGRCLRDASRMGSDLTSCVENDADGRVATARDKTSEVDSTRCSDSPEFGYAGADAINDAGVTGPLAMLVELLGPEPAGAVVAADADRAGSNCQAAILRASDNLLSAKLSAFNRCKRDGLADGVVTSESDLEMCADHLQVDPTGNVDRARSGLARAVEQRCDGVPLDGSFPGACATSPAFANCVAERADCRACAALDRMDDLARDCDQLDDGQATGSCAACKLHGLDFGPYTDGQDPTVNPAIAPSVLEERIERVAYSATWLRTYGATNGLEEAGRLGHKHGLKIAMGAWLSTNLTANQTEIASVIAKAQAGEADMILVANEAVLRGDLSAAQLIAYMGQVKAVVPPGVQVTTAEPYGVWLANPQLIAAADVVFVHIHPLWDGQSIDQAAAHVAQKYQQVTIASGGKAVVIGETGWPSAGQTVGAAVPSAANAARYLQEFTTWARSNDVEFFYFAALSEPWKAQFEGPLGAHWGIHDSSGTLKPGMSAALNCAHSTGP